MGSKKVMNWIWTLAMCVTGCALTLPLLARDIGTPVDVRTTITGVREVPAGNPLPGLHAEARIKGKAVDVYIAPMDFVKKYDVRVKPGEEVHLIGIESPEGNADVILGREITTGVLDRRTGIFHENMTIYLRNDQGPLWE